MSGSLRKLIGQSKARLLPLIQEAKDVDSLEDVQESSEAEVFDDICEVVDIAVRLHVELSRIDRYEQEWQQLINKDPNEQAIRDDYKSRLGDYSMDIEEARRLLAGLSDKYQQFVKIHRGKSNKQEIYPAFEPQSIVSLYQVDPTRGVYNSQSTHNLVNNQSVGASTVASQPNMNVNVPTVYSLTLQSVQSTQPVQSLQFSQPMPPTLYGTSGQLPVPLGAAESSSVPFGAAGQPSQQSLPLGATVHQGYQVPSFQYTQLVYPVSQQPQFPMMMHSNNYSVPIPLPSIQLPVFTGDPLQYGSFIALFSSIIDSPHLQDIHKYVYLQNSLQGNAKRLIQHLPLSAASYSMARQILHDRYGNTTPVYQQLLHQLQDLPSVAHCQHVNQVLDFWTDATTIFYQLRNIDSECDNSITAHIISRKLPIEYIEFLYTGPNADRRYKASELLETLRKRVQENAMIDNIFKDNTFTDNRKVTTMSIQQTHQPHQSQHQQLNELRHQQSTNHHEPSHSAQHCDKPFKPKSPCAFCMDSNNLHRHEDCPVHQTAEDRRMQANYLRLCFKCLKTGHNSYQCDRYRLCFYCQGTHHSALCVSDLQSCQPNLPDDSYSEHCGQSESTELNHSQQPIHSSRTTFAISTKIEGNQPLDDVQTITFSATSQALPIVVPPTISPEELPNHQHVDKPRGVAMMTASTTVNNDNGDPVQATVFFDNGSDHSYISQQLAKDLRLDVIDRQHLSIQSFQSDAKKDIIANRVLVEFNIQDKKIKIPLTEISSIFSPVTTGKLDDASLIQLLHDPNAVLPRTNVQPDILIGLDYMSQLLGDTISKRLPNGTTMHWTDCGVIVTGTEPEPEPPPLETTEYSVKPTGIYAHQSNFDQALVNSFSSDNVCGNKSTISFQNSTIRYSILFHLQSHLLFYLLFYFHYYSRLHRAIQSLCYSIDLGEILASRLLLGIHPVTFASAFGVDPKTPLSSQSFLPSFFLWERLRNGSQEQCDVYDVKFS